jgi:hypothetical protein
LQTDFPYIKKYFDLLKGKEGLDRNEDLSKSLLRVARYSVFNLYIEEQKRIQFCSAKNWVY